VNKFIRGCGRALLIGGALTILISVVATPLLPRHQGSAAVMSSRIFLLRESGSGVVALLLLFGCLGLHLVQEPAPGLFAMTAFLVSFFGCALLFAVEWTNAFVMHAVARASPETLRILDDSSLLNVGFGSAAGIFALGWLLLAVRVWRGRVLPRWAPLATLVGLLSIPALQATLGLAGAIVGNVIFGVGLMALGGTLAMRTLRESGARHNG
jgi:hypothetical protein